MFVELFGYGGKKIRGNKNLENFQVIGPILAYLKLSPIG